MGTLISLCTLGLMIYQAVNLKDVKGILKDTEDIKGTLDEIEKISKLEASE